MRKGKRQTTLRFSLGFTASQAIGLGLVAAMFAYMADQFFFNFDAFSASHRSSPRYAWFEDIASSNGGKAGAVIFALLTLLTFWYALIAAWQFFTRREAATLTERGLLLHLTYWRRGEIPFAEVLSATVGEESRSSWLFKRHRLLITFASRRDVRLRSLTTEGGVEALKAFAKELNARRR